MRTNLLDGQALSRRINRTVKELAARLPRAPGLTVVLVGEDPASRIYVRRKGIVAEHLGFVHRQVDLPVGTPQAALLETIDALNHDPTVDGILVQLPLPPGFDPLAVMHRIDPTKDVDGLNPVSTGLLSQGRPALVPCTPLGIMRILSDAGIGLSGIDACVIGRSNIVGRPVSMLLEQAGCTVTLCHSRTRDLDTIVRRSDLVLAAAGQEGLVPGAWIKPGAVVIDVGMNRRLDGTLCGDVVFEDAVKRAGAITPVPKGVGPMTIAMLMENTLRASAARQGLSVPL